PQLRGIVGKVASFGEVAVVAVVRPDLDPVQGADRDDVLFDAGPGAQGRRNHQATLGVAAELFRMREEVADERPIARVLDRRSLEAGANLGPGRSRVERQARIRVGDGKEESRAEALAEA